MNITPRTGQKNHQYFTWSKKTPNLPSATGVKYRSSFLYNSIKAYSELDYTVKQSSTLCAFVKNRKRRHFEAQT